MKSMLSSPDDIREIWKRASQKLDKMSDKEQLGIFVKAGILTPKGNVKKRYREVIVPAGSVRKARGLEKKRGVGPTSIQPAIG